MADSTKLGMVMAVFAAGNPPLAKLQLEVTSAVRRLSQRERVAILRLESEKHEFPGKYPN
jgi:hypothetical protein